jgi:hypothetical protein
VVQYVPDSKRRMADSLRHVRTYVLLGSIHLLGILEPFFFHFSNLLTHSGFGNGNGSEGTHIGAPAYTKIIIPFTVLCCLAAYYQPRGSEHDDLDDWDTIVAKAALRHPIFGARDCRRTRSRILAATWPHTAFCWIVRFSLISVRHST